MQQGALPIGVRRREEIERHDRPCRVGKAYLDHSSRSRVWELVWSVTWGFGKVVRAGQTAR